MAPRYAIYFVPRRDSELYRFGISILGYDAYAGASVRQDADLRAWQAAAEGPRRYGFHATLKAPFHMPAYVSEHALVDAVRRFALSRSAVPPVKLHVARLGGFAVLRPIGSCVELNKLAGDCVTAFEPFRASLTDHDRDRRAGLDLSHRQKTYLEQWGYPHVFDDFRFHMTLLGPLPSGYEKHIHNMLRAKFGQFTGAEQLVVDRIALLRQAEAGAPFVVIHSACFAG